MEFSSMMDFGLTALLGLAIAALALLLLTGCYVCIEMRDEIREWKNKGDKHGDE